MNLWAAGAWGLAGALCVEAWELYRGIRHSPEWDWRAPIPQGLAAYLFSVAIRMLMGAVVAGAAAASDQVSGALAAVGLGIAAPLVIEKFAREVPLDGATGVDHHTALAAPETRPVEPSRTLPSPGAE